jgi:acid phosphatase family membrane protein YuiD
MMRSRSIKHAVLKSIVQKPSLNRSITKTTVFIPRDHSRLLYTHLSTSLSLRSGLKSSRRFAISVSASCPLVSFYDMRGWLP